MQADLREAENQLRKKEESLNDLGRQLDDAKKRASAAEGMVHDQEEARDGELEVSFSWEGCLYQR